MSKYEQNGKKDLTLNYEDMQKEWVRCPLCEIRVKSGNVEDHVSRVHQEKLEVKGAPKENGFPYAFLIVMVVVILVISSVGYSFFINTSDNTDDISSDESNDVDDDWWKSYQPQYVIGSRQNDWWIDKPEMNQEAGSSVEHPQWVLDNLKNKPVVIFAHSDDCAPCIQQQRDIEPIVREYGAEIVYYDFLTDGSEPRAYEAYESYDPNGPPAYIPLTVMVTLGEYNGQIQVIWHSTEGATGEDWIRDYLKDAIYYHKMNSNLWGGV